MELQATVKLWRCAGATSCGAGRGQRCEGLWAARANPRLIAAATGERLRGRRGQSKGQAMRRSESRWFWWCMEQMASSLRSPCRSPNLCLIRRPCPRWLVGMRRAVALTLFGLQIGRRALCVLHAHVERCLHGLRWRWRVCRCVGWTAWMSSCRRNCAKHISQRWPSRLSTAASSRSCLLLRLFNKPHWASTKLWKNRGTRRQRRRVVPPSRVAAPSYRWQLTGLVVKVSPLPYAIPYQSDWVHKAVSVVYVEV
jgi:hypothetical protein